MPKTIQPEIYEKDGLLPSGSNVEVITLPNNKAYLLRFVFKHTPEITAALKKKFNIKVEIEYEDDMVT